MISILLNYNKIFIKFTNSQAVGVSLSTMFISISDAIELYDNKIDFLF